ncbi:MAG: DUF6387 family protein [Methylococcaceae bacterium]
MSKELDTSWFDLKNYDYLSKLDLPGWIEQITKRLYAHIITTDYVNENNFKKSDLIDVVDTLKRGRAESFSGEWHTEPAVYDLSVSDAFGISTDPRVLITYTRRYSEIKNDHFFDSQHPFKKAIFINLSASDEQLKNEFSKWLSDNRAIESGKHQKKLFSQVNFDHWVKNRVIPYLDLKLIAKIEGKKITQDKIAKLIFSDEHDISIIDRLRDTTKPTADILMNSGAIRTLLSQHKSELRDK